eukprot:416639-Lingulodinium_polyedra.AAC.1
MHGSALGRTPQPQDLGRLHDAAGGPVEARGRAGRGAHVASRPERGRQPRQPAKSANRSADA